MILFAGLAEELVIGVSATQTELVQVVVRVKWMHEGTFLEQFFPFLEHLL
jgi:hypothetical protein